MNDFFNVFVMFVTNAMPYVFTWRIGMLIVTSIVNAATGRRLEF